MKYFLAQFEQTYNKSNPFGNFPDWTHYPSTGTHIGSDFVVPVGTPIVAPQDGEMYKAVFNTARGNTGVYIFIKGGMTWGLELCHLRELPKLGTHKEGEVVAYSGNTGAATTGAHLHAVLHRDAAVTKHYAQLQSRTDFLRLQQEGALVDCWQWFRTHMG